MGIGPLELQGTISRAQDFSILKHNEDGKGLMDHANAVNVVRAEADNKSNNVTRSEGTRESNKRFDAKEKGSNEYSGDGGKQKNKKESDGKVLIKGQSMSFDIRI